MKVQINAGGRVVVIECADTNVKDVAAEVERLWKLTEGATDTPPKFGFSAEVEA